MAGLLGPERDSDAVPQSVPLLRRLFCNMRDITRHFDATIWMGDLNYRLEGTRAHVEHAACTGNLQVGRLETLCSHPGPAGFVPLGLQHGRIEV